MRAGGKALTLLGGRRNFLILHALADGPRGQLELRRAAGFPAQSTLRGHLKTLEETGAIVKRRRDGFPGALEHELTEAGDELLVVAEHLRRWLADAPRGPIEPGGDAARAAVKGLVDGWLARMLAPLADRALSLTELDRQLTTISYPTIERRLEAMRLAEQVEERERSAGGTPYALAPWLRRGLMPLAVAARWEHRHRIEGTDPVTRLEIEAALKISAPLLSLLPSSSGLCQVAVRVPADSRSRRRVLGFIELRDGGVSLVAPYPQRKPDAWISGTADAWFDAVIEGDERKLRKSGDPQLPSRLLTAVRTALFGDQSTEA